MVADPRRKTKQENGESDKRWRQKEALDETLDETLDEALENTFPASDPISLEQPTTTGARRFPINDFIHTEP